MTLGHLPAASRPPSGVSSDATPDSAPRALAPRSALLAGCALVGLVLATYAGVLSADFTWDDDENVVDNQVLRSGDGLRQIWLVPAATQQYYPLMYSGYWLEYQLWGLSPLGYHLVNVLLHASAAVLTWRLLLRLQVPGAWLAAAIFAVHPVMVESVAWITELKNVMSLSLALGALLCYLRFDPPEPGPAGDGSGAPPGTGRWGWYAAALALFALALCAKTVVVTLPAVILVIDWWKRGELKGRDGLWLAPFFALAVGMGLMTMHMETHYLGAQGKDWSLSPVGRLLLAGRALWFYAGKLVWPHPLVFFYPRWTIDTDVAWQYLFPLAALALLVALWLARGKIGRGPLAAVLIFAGVLFPMLGFFNIFYMRYAYISDHFQYHAAIALIALATAGASLFAARLSAPGKNAARVTAGIVILALASVAVARTQVYRDRETFYRDTIAKNPQGTIARSNLSVYLDSLGRHVEAIELARETLALEPDDEVAQYNLAVFLLKRGRRDGFAAGQLEETISELERSLTLSRAAGEDAAKEARLRNYLADALLRRGARDGFGPDDLCTIIAHLHEALRLHPEYGDAGTNLGLALVAANQPEEACAAFSRALAIDPSAIQALFGMAGALAATGKTAQAIEYYERTIAERPDHALAHQRLALLLLDAHRTEEAVAHLAAALRSDPQFADAHYSLAGVLAGQDDLAGAREHYQAAVKARPQFPRAWNNLGVVLMNLGEADQAILCFEKAIVQDDKYAEAKANLDKAQQWKREQAAP